MAIEGDLGHFSLPSLVQVVCTEKRDAMLFLWNKDQVGKIYFRAGEIVQAIAGTRQGEEAAYDLLTWDAGKFRLTDSPGDCKQTISRGWKQLLLEAMTRHDEKHREQHPASQSAVRSDPTAAEDGQLQDRLFALLSTIEQDMYVLSDAKTKRRPAQALGVLAELINKTAASAQAACGPGAVELETLVHSMVEPYPQLDLISVRNGRLSIDSLLKAYTGWSWTGERRVRFFRQVVAGMIALLEAHFHAMASRLASPESRNDVLDASRSLVLDLRNLTEGIPF